MHNHICQNCKKPWNCLEQGQGDDLDCRWYTFVKCPICLKLEQINNMKPGDFQSKEDFLKRWSK